MHPNDDTVSVAKTVAASVMDGQSTYMGMVTFYLQISFIFLNSTLFA